MRNRSLLCGAVAVLAAVSSPHPAPGAVILFSEAENSINGQEVLPRTTVTVTNVSGTCPAVIVAPFTQACAR